ncbi:MAG TPA: hypothetical protein PK828_07885 [Limnochordia bacterium]|jgi:hypothetical protein|nr:hypothetical protein [Limnochordia bacterium]
MLFHGCLTRTDGSGDKLENHSCISAAAVLSKSGFDSGLGAVQRCLSPHLYGVPLGGIYTWREWYFFPAKTLFSAAHP